MNRAARAHAVFLDKDGTLIDDLAYNVDPARIRLAAQAAPGLRLLAQHGYGLHVVSNQPGVALGLFPEQALLGVEQRLRALLDAQGIALGSFYYCPHLPPEQARVRCLCRKPAPGLLTRAAREHRLELARCWMVGDILDDIEAGRRAGCRTVLIDNGNETRWQLTALRRPHARAAHLLQAAQLIVQADAADGNAAGGAS